MSSAQRRESLRPALPRRLRRLSSGLVLGVLLGGAWLPLLEAALAQEGAAFCGRGGRCCCMQGRERADDRPCLRRGCGCDQPESATVSVGPFRLDAVLPATGVPARAEAAEHGNAPPTTRLLSRPHAPPTPPPRPSASA